MEGWVYISPARRTFNPVFFIQQLSPSFSLFSSLHGVAEPILKNQSEQAYFYVVFQRALRFFLISPLPHSTIFTFLLTVICLSLASTHKRQTSRGISSDSTMHSHLGLIQHLISQSSSPWASHTLDSKLYGFFPVFYNVQSVAEHFHHFLEVLNHTESKDTDNRQPYPFPTAFTSLAHALDFNEDFIASLKPVNVD